MKSTFHLFIAISTTFLSLTSCKKEVKTEVINETAAEEIIPTTTADNSMNSLDWNGTYSGITPCADCEGIETSLTLNKDNSYILTTKYLGKSTKNNESKGTFSWNAEGNTIILSTITDGPNQFFVGENQLTQLDMSGKKITGALAEKYILTKK
ncbi:hypothetical protein FCR2A7T_09680 [Flavobacterium cauense R2A-7]|uniref:Putative lipoprotein NlpE involved in copper resistance n=1 Tax=Flavobacterium cauense R2A-7 TaxID=1341154 RepID=V6S8G4_9FLAO|nr:copper resistance protein NlpE [Flavobacterium cauense]ESU20660.1 hypothetical protein FCR2A7T_09680 [Flavobacterium cauense R2A-7]KGO82962.1 hypothetical protein Q762_04215 [Flavobacterium cauense R2A-7]TWI10758.1 putative lipoprotein NlpE involved in copper resistance [Flavobacterium cauense R2A-7]